jgi:superfamily II DNA or RNA helicase
MIELFDYQAEKVDEVFDLITVGHRRILVVSPTASGKTVIASEIIRRLNIQRLLSLSQARYRWRSSVMKYRIRSSANTSATAMVTS